MPTKETLRSSRPCVGPRQGPRPKPDPVDKTLGGRTLPVAGGGKAEAAEQGPSQTGTPSNKSSGAHGPALHNGEWARARQEPVPGRSQIQHILKLYFACEPAPFSKPRLMLHGAPVGGEDWVLAHVAPSHQRLSRLPVQDTARPLRLIRQ